MQKQDHQLGLADTGWGRVSGSLGAGDASPGWGAGLDQVSMTCAVAAEQKK